MSLYRILLHRAMVTAKGPWHANGNWRTGWEHLAMDVHVEVMRNFIAGQWESEPDSMPAINPATGELIAQLPRSTRATASRAVAAARGAQKGWAARSVWERSEMCFAIASQIDAARTRMARTVS